VLKICIGGVQKFSLVVVGTGGFGAEMSRLDAFHLAILVFQAWSEMDLAVSYKGPRGCAGCCVTLPLEMFAMERSCKRAVQFDGV
jgi:hypothetical protein